MSNDIPEEIYVRKVTKKTLSAIRPESPILLGCLDGKLMRTKYIRADLVPQWQPIETAPKDGREILLALWSGHPEHKTSFCWAINGHYEDGFFYSKDPTVGRLIPPTHWMPITPPPTEENDE